MYMDSPAPTLPCLFFIVCSTLSLVSDKDRQFNSVKSEVLRIGGWWYTKSLSESQSSRTRSADSWGWEVFVLVHAEAWGKCYWLGAVQLLLCPSGTHHPVFPWDKIDSPCPLWDLHIQIPSVQKPPVTFVFHLEFLGSKLLYMVTPGGDQPISSPHFS